MIDQVAAAIGERKRIGVAVSGGADSLFLLTALHDLGAAVAVLHVNHQLRGMESDADEAFVRDLAAARDLSFHAAALPPAPGNIEQEARRLRYKFFADAIENGICSHVATGHTLDDQAETVLFRFLRGSGAAGLSGIRPETESGLIRPLLGLRRGAIREWLAERGIVWREDASNSDTSFRRNYIRREVLPRLAELNPSLPELLASTATWAQGEEEFWAAEIARLAPLYLKTAPETVFIEIGPFSQLPVAVQRRLLRRAMEHVRGNLRTIGFQHVESARKLMASREGSGRIQLPDLDVYRSFDLLRMTPQRFDARIERNFSVPMKIPGETIVDAPLLTIGMELADPSGVYNGEVNALDPAKCRDQLHLRNWRPGDQFERPGHPGTAVKIKTLFQDYRVPLWERRTWPVIVMGDSIVWTRRFGPARQFAATAESKSILLVKERCR
ncbi:MAG TPA: tRNA lysidine(34) synthetase TilS [Bryobacteraceae bacterium]|nr:tRNA lysidine(34) synthetase TilS [Bryobacteraceae bacterium]